MTIDWNVVATFVAPIVALFMGYWLKDILKKRPKLLYRMVASDPVTLTDDTKSPLTMQMHSISLKNSGKAPTNNVRVGHKVLPAYSVSPVTSYKVETLPDKGTEIVFPRMLAEEEITITYLYSPPLKWEEINAHVKSDDGFASPVYTFPPPPSSFFSRWVLPFIIFTTTLSLTVSIGEWVAKNVFE